MKSVSKTLSDTKVPSTKLAPVEASLKTNGENVYKKKVIQTKKEGKIKSYNRRFSSNSRQNNVSSQSGTVNESFERYKEAMLKKSELTMK